MLVKGLCSATCFCCIRSPVYSFCPWYLVFMKMYYCGTVRKYDECPNIYKFNAQVAFLYVMAYCNTGISFVCGICIILLHGIKSIE